MEVGSIDLMPDGKLALGTRRGEIWIVSGAGSNDASNVSYKLFASGLHEVLGIAYNPRTRISTPPRAMRSRASKTLTTMVVPMSLKM